MPEDATRRASGNIAFENVQIRTADRSLDDLDDGIRRRRNFGRRTIFQSLLPRSLIHKRFHTTIIRPELDSFCF